MMPGLSARRQIHRLRVLARHRAAQGIAAPHDFTLGFDGPACAAELQRERSLIYCLNLQTERVVFTDLPADFRSAVFAEPFLYGAQLDQARQAWSVPVERLAEVVPAPPQLAPVLLFSPGRSGSTLLARMADRAFACAASEPDTLTRLAIMTGDERCLLPDAAAAAIVRATAASLARYLGPAPLIKLRSQCNARADLLLRALPQAQAAFLFRAPFGFARSRNRAFGEPAEDIARQLGEAVLALLHAQRAGRAPQVLWYEALQEDAACCLRALLGPRAAALGEVPRADAHAIAEGPALPWDSQAGSGISRDALRGLQVAEGFDAAFAAAWAAWLDRYPDLSADHGAAGMVIARIAAAIAAGPGRDAETRQAAGNA